MYISPSRVQTPMSSRIGMHVCLHACLFADILALDSSHKYHSKTILGDWIALRTLPDLDATGELAWRLRYINIETRIATDLKALMHLDFGNLPQHIQCQFKKMLQKALTSLAAQTELPPDSPVPTEIPPDSPLPSPPIDSLAQTTSPTDIPVPPTPPKDPSAEGAEAQLKGAQPNRVMLLRAQYMQRKANKLTTKARLAARPETPKASQANTDVYATTAAPAASTAAVGKKQKRHKQKQMQKQQKHPTAPAASTAAIRKKQKRPTK